MVLCLAACGDDRDKKDNDDDSRRDKARAVVGRVQALNARLNQLEDTLDQLDQETQIQRNRISAAKGDLAVIRETIAAAEGRAARYLDDDSTEAAILRHSRSDRRDSEEREREREEAENRTMSTVLLLAFLAVVIIFGGKLWRDRARATDGMDVSEGVASHGGYTYPTPPSAEPAPGAVPPGDVAPDTPDQAGYGEDESHDEPPPASPTV